MRYLLLVLVGLSFITIATVLDRHHVSDENWPLVFGPGILGISCIVSPIILKWRPKGVRPPSVLNRFRSVVFPLLGIGLTAHGLLAQAGVIEPLGFHATQHCLACGRDHGLDGSLGGRPRTVVACESCARLPGLEDAAAELFAAIDSRIAPTSHPVDPGIIVINLSTVRLANPERVFRGAIPTSRFLTQGWSKDEPAHMYAEIEGGGKAPSPEQTLSLRLRLHEKGHEIAVVEQQAKLAVHPIDEESRAFEAAMRAPGLTPIESYLQRYGDDDEQHGTAALDELRKRQEEAELRSAVESGALGDLEAFLDRHPGRDPCTEKAFAAFDALRLRIAAREDTDFGEALARGTEDAFAAFVAKYGPRGRKGYRIGARGDAGARYLRDRFGTVQGVPDPAHRSRARDLLIEALEAVHDPFAPILGRAAAADGVVRVKLDIVDPSEDDGYRSASWGFLADELGRAGFQLEEVQTEPFDVRLEVGRSAKIGKFPGWRAGWREAVDLKWTIGASTGAARLETPLVLDRSAGVKAATAAMISRVLPIPW